MDDLAQALSKDLDGSFPGVVEHMGARVYWGLRRMYNDHQEAEDLTQETFIRAYKALCGYDTGRIKALKLEPWLWTIALNIGRNHLRDQARRPTYVELEEAADSDPEIVDSQAWDERLRRLNQHQRAAVVLRHVLGLGIAEISEATGRPEGTVKADIHRGLATLKTILEEEE
jgi:RNA polymerase sigma factor (sigma-70 family)